MTTSSQMASTFKLPLVPGTTCGEEMMRRNFRKTQIFGAKADKATHTKPVPVDYSAVNAALAATGAAASASSAEGSPSKAGAEDLSGRVLRFYGYTREAVPESSVERERVRKIVLCYFLEDGTLSAAEPKTDNSGFSFQGTVVKRHLVPGPDGTPIQFHELRVGAVITIYGRKYHLVDADPFTRSFYEAGGAPLAPAEEYPGDAYTALRARPVKAHDVPSIAATSPLNITLSSAQVRAAQQFFANDRRVLRCDATWDDTASLYGEVHYLTLYYFLADDNIAICEKDGVNTGRDPFPNFVKRMRIPKPRADGSAAPATTSALSATVPEANDFYTAADIRIGSVFNVFGRQVRICDYDSFTREYLAANFGVTEYKPISFAAPPKPKVVHEPPPHNGFGDEDDSIGNCRRLDIKPPRKDGTKFAKHGTNTVKFLMRLDNGVASDEVRRFVLTCFLADDTISIFEPVQRNSGIVGGKFLQRQKVRGANGKPLVAGDFYVGIKTTINGFPFIVLATDERSLSYMEAHAGEFAHSNAEAATAKLRAMLLSATSGLADALAHSDAAAAKSGTSGVDYPSFVAALQKLGLPLSQQEVTTILRHLDHRGESFITFDELISNVLPAGATVASDPRNWADILAEFTGAAAAATGGRAAAAAAASSASSAEVAQLAARAARVFAELYDQRRALFNSELKFSIDYGVDGKIGAREFKMAVTERLKLPIGGSELDAFATRLFPAPRAQRVTFEELMRLLSNTSNYSHNLSAICASK